MYALKSSQTFPLNLTLKIKPDIPFKSKSLKSVPDVLNAAHALAVVALVCDVVTHDDVSIQLYRHLCCLRAHRKHEQFNC